MDKGQEHITVVVNEAHFTLGGHLDLVKLHFNDFGGVLNHFGGGLTRNDVENADNLGRHRVDQSNHVTRQRDMALIQKLNSQTLVLGRRDKFTIVVVNIEVLGSIDETEVFDTLNDSVN